MFSELAFEIFDKSIAKYHIKDDVNQRFENPYPKDKIEHLLYRKNWTDTGQWHQQDIMRDPGIDPVEALAHKGKIDASNQDRAAMGEFIGSFCLNKKKDVAPAPGATINSARRARPIARLSLLAS